MKAKTFMAQYQQEPYPPGQGGDRHGWTSSEELRSLGITFSDTALENCQALIQIPEERIVLRDVFGEVGTPEILEAS